MLSKFLGPRYLQLAKNWPHLQTATQAQNFNIGIWGGRKHIFSPKQLPYFSDHKTHFFFTKHAVPRDTEGPGDPLRLCNSDHKTQALLLFGP